LARNGLPKAPFYLTGHAGGQPFSVHAEGERVIMTGPGGRQEIDLIPPRAESGTAASLPLPVCPQGVVSSEGPGFEEPLGPGESPLDEGVARLREGFGAVEGGDV
jgi:hypothetical protein